MLLFNGKPDPPSQIRIPLGETTPFFEQVVVRGLRKRENLGQALVVGDWNDDGIADIAAGAIFGRDLKLDRARGRVYVLPGRPTWPTDEVRIDDVPDVTTIIGAKRRDEFGLALSPGKFGGGVLSLLASAWQGDGPDDSRGNSGEVYLFSQSLLAATGAGPTASDSSSDGRPTARDLYFLSGSWMAPPQGARKWMDKSGDGVVGPDDLLMLHRQWRRPIVPR